MFDAKAERIIRFDEQSVPDTTSAMLSDPLAMRFFGHFSLMDDSELLTIVADPHAGRATLSGDGPG